ncbi:hypothetical protein LJC59_02685 [Desulfovibrio sp. OttesenSCG-928-A18]|nr:hypothetical protein [Desulfovibrio sp. OttesenSCG-928-A18]
MAQAKNLMRASGEARRKRAFDSAAYTVESLLRSCQERDGRIISVEDRQINHAVAEYGLEDSDIIADISGKGQ